MAKNEQKDEPLNPHLIPDNFADSGRIINGMFKTRNFIEACALGIPLGIIFWSCLSFLPSNWRFTLTIFFAAIGFDTGINGWQGDTIFEFVQHVMAFNKKKRYTLYNKRVKKEVKPDYLFKDKQKTQMDEFVEKARKLMLGNSENDYDASEILNGNEKVIFEDNMSVLGTPDELKSKKQLRQEAKERKRLEKQAQKIRKEETRRKFLIEQASRDKLKELERSARASKKSKGTKKR